MKDLNLSFLFKSFLRAKKQALDTVVDDHQRLKLTEQSDPDRVLTRCTAARWAFVTYIQRKLEGFGIRFSSQV